MKFENAGRHPPPQQHAVRLAPFRTVSEREGVLLSGKACQRFTQEWLLNFGFARTMLSERGKRNPSRTNKNIGGQMSVEAILKTKGNNIFTVRPEHSVSEAAALMAAKRVGVAIVCDTKGRLMGVVSERDVVSGITQYGKGVLDMPVRNIMTSPVVTCMLGDSVKKVMEVMTERRIRHLPVLDGDELVGMISIGDAVNFRLNEAQMETAVLRDFAATR